MSDSNHTFDIELDKLLKEYLGDDCYGNINLSIDYPEKEANGVSEKINNFYKDQLQINVGTYNERIKIDRTITFSEKKLDANKFCNFLIELGKVCISGGKLNLAAEVFKKANLCSSGLSKTYKAESLMGMANIHIKRGNWSRGLNIISEAQELYKEANDIHGIAVCENLIGTINGELGDIENAKKHFQQSLSLIDVETDLELAAELETNLGIIDHMEENSNDALNHLLKARKIFKELGNFKNYANVALSLGLVYFEAEDYLSAISSLDEGIEIAKQHRFLSILCLLYHAKSRVLIPTKAFYYAAEFADKALEISHDLNDKVTLADIYKVKGIIERELKNFEAAESHFLNSIRINTSLKNEMNTAETYVELGILYRELNNSNSKQSSLKNALGYYKKIKSSVKAKKIEDVLDFQEA
jgi:tetratricopeptide (TPR) repeat protein